MNTMTTTKFEMGLVYATRGALRTFEEADENSLILLKRHSSGDWGDVSEADQRENEFALQNGLRVLSAYHLGNGTKIWIITEADRSVTTMLLPAEY